MAFANLKAQIDEYAKDKWWQWHIPLWIFGLYLFIQLLRFDLTKPLPFAVSVMHSFDFMLHELAHIFTSWLPALVTAAAGSGSELILGLLLVYGAFQFRNYFASLFCCLWLMLVLMSIGSYMADAVPQNIPLVSLGGALAGSEQVTHDWNFIFGELGLLGSSGFIGGTVKFIGVLVGLFGLVFSAWIIYKMAVAARKAKEQKKEVARPIGPGFGPTTDTAPTAKVELYPTPTKGNLAERKPEQEPKQ